MITLLITFTAGAILGALCFRNNAAKASSLEFKGRELLDALKGKKK